MSVAISSHIRRRCTVTDFPDKKQCENANQTKPQPKEAAQARRLDPHHGGNGEDGKALHRNDDRQRDAGYAACGFEKDDAAQPEDERPGREETELLPVDAKALSADAIAQPQHRTPATRFDQKVTPSDRGLSR